MQDAALWAQQVTAEAVSTWMVSTGRLSDAEAYASIFEIATTHGLYQKLSQGQFGAAASLLLPFGTSLAVACLCASLALLACLPPPLGFGSRHAVGSGIPEIKAILSGYWLARYLSARALLAKIGGLAAALSAGFFVGKEGPLVHISAALATLLMKLPCFRPIEANHQRKRAMIAAAASVGVVSTFGACSQDQSQSSPCAVACTQTPPPHHVRHPHRACSHGACGSSIGLVSAA